VLAILIKQVLAILVRVLAWGYAVSGGSIKRLEISGVSFGEPQTRTGKACVMSEKEKTKKNSASTYLHLKHGEEPIGLLLALVYSPIETLRQRGLVELYEGEGKLAIIIANTRYDPKLGFVEALATPLPTVANTAPESVGSGESA
jgi:hypothetical protein